MKKTSKITKMLTKIINSHKCITNSELIRKNYKNQIALTRKIEKKIIIINQIVKLKLQLIKIKNILII